MSSGPAGQSTQNSQALIRRPSLDILPNELTALWLLYLTPWDLLMAVVASKRWRRALASSPEIRRSLRTLYNALPFQNWALHAMHSIRHGRRIDQWMFQTELTNGHLLVCHSRQQRSALLIFHPFFPVPPGQPDLFVLDDDWEMEITTSVRHRPYLENIRRGIAQGFRPGDVPTYVPVPKLQIRFISTRDAGVWFTLVEVHRYNLQTRLLWNYLMREYVDYINGPRVIWMEATRARRFSGFGGS